MLPFSNHRFLLLCLGCSWPVCLSACSSEPDLDDPESEVDDPDGNGSTSGVGGTGESIAGVGGGSTTGSGGSGVSPEASCLGNVLIDDFEDSATFPLLRPYNDGTAGGTMNQTSSFSAENAVDGTASLHLSGSGFTAWGAGIGREFDAPLECKSRSIGIRFRAKGNGTVTVAAPVTSIVPVEEGGSCTAAEACHNAHETTVSLTASWQTYEVLWTDLEQLPGWGLPATFDPKSVLEILFAARPEAMPFDFWIDDIELMDSGDPLDPDPDPDPGSGGSGTDPEGCVLDGILGESGFNSWFQTRRNPFYTYANLCIALEGFPGFASSGDETLDKREVAAFFANVARETGELEYIEQIVKDPPTYFGRGPIQLTHSYNYQAAGDFLGIDLVQNPGLVATDPVITWQTALWFWMHSDGAGKGTCHGAIVGGLGFGQTINIINGGLECGGENTAARQRITYFEGFCSNLGISPGSNLTCW